MRRYRASLILWAVFSVAWIAWLLYELAIGNVRAASTNPLLGFAIFAAICLGLPLLALVLGRGVMELSLWLRRPADRAPPVSAVRHSFIGGVMQVTGALSILFGVWAATLIVSDIQLILVEVGVTTGLLQFGLAAVIRRLDALSEPA